MSRASESRWPAARPPGPERQTAGTQAGAQTGGGAGWVFGLLFSGVAYALTAAPGVLWGDSGEIQLYLLLDEWLVGDALCRSHPTFYAVARFVSWILPCSPARSANLTSAFFGALTVANVAWLLGLWCRRFPSVICGVGLLTFSHAFWQMSTNAEVLTLYTALMTFEWMCLAKAAQFPRMSEAQVRAALRGWAVGAVFFNGLGWSTHNLAMLSLPAYLVLAWRVRTTLRQSGAMTFAAMALAWLAGLTPLIVLSLTHVEPLGGFGGVLRSWLVGGYAERVFNRSGLPRLVLMSAGYLVLSFPTPLLVFVPAGWLAARKRIGLGLWRHLTLCLTVLLVFVVRYNVVDQYTFFVGVHVGVALAIGLGVDAWLERMRAGGRSGAAGGRQRLCLLLSLLSPAVYAALPTLVRQFAPDLVPVRAVAYRDPLTWILHPWRTGYDAAQRYADDVLAVLPHDAALIADTQVFGPINYTQIAHSRRLDVRLIQRLARQPWLAPVDDPEALIRRHLDLGTLYAAYPAAPYVPGWLARDVVFEPVGPVFKAVRGSKGS